MQKLIVFKSMSVWNLLLYFQPGHLGSSESSFGFMDCGDGYDIVVYFSPAKDIY